MISNYTINQIEPIVIPATQTELLAYLHTLSFISVNENADNTYTICFDVCPKSTRLYHHLSQLEVQTTLQ